MKRLILLFITCLCLSTGFAQETIIETNSLTDNVVEKFTVLKSNDTVKQGLYQAIYRKKTAIASGRYEQGKKTGIWHYFDPFGTLLENFNYSTMQLLYEAPKDTNKIRIEYSVDPMLTDTGKVTIPIRIGGTYYGYLPYLKHFKLNPADYGSTYGLYGILQLLVSPSGRLAQCQLFIKLRANQNTIDSYNLDPALLTDEEKQFLPARFKGTSVTSTIYILCKLTPNWGISIY